MAETSPAPVSDSALAGLGKPTRAQIGLLTDDSVAFFNKDQILINHFFE
jgi:hypothetical protein